MATIWDFIKDDPSERPKYTRFELGRMVRENRIKNGLEIADLANQYNFKERTITYIEEGSCALNVKMYNFICDFLEMTTEEVLSKDIDDMAAIERSLENAPKEIKEAVELANRIFNEMVMQEKISD